MTKIQLKEQDDMNYMEFLFYICFSIKLMTLICI